MAAIEQSMCLVTGWHIQISIPKQRTLWRALGGALSMANTHLTQKEMEHCLAVARGRRKQVILAIYQMLDGTGTRH